MCVCVCVCVCVCACVWVFSIEVKTAGLISVNFGSRIFLDDRTVLGWLSTPKVSGSKTGPGVAPKPQRNENNH